MEHRSPADAKPEPQHVSIAFENIEKARLIPDWAALGFGPTKAEPPAKPGKRSPGRKAPGKTSVGHKTIGNKAAGKAKTKRPSDS